MFALASVHACVASVLVKVLCLLCLTKRHAEQDDKQTAQQERPAQEPPISRFDMFHVRSFLIVVSLPI